MNLKKYHAPNFWLTEFVPKEVYSVLGNDSVHLLDNRLFVIIQVIRNEIGAPITINNWFEGGRFNESGLRVYNTLTGAERSKHKLGQAMDAKWDYSKMSIEQVINYIDANKHLFLALRLGAIGIYEGFIHLDTREIDGDEFVTWRG